MRLARFERLAKFVLDTLIVLSFMNLDRQECLQRLACFWMSFIANVSV